MDKKKTIVERIASGTVELFLFGLMIALLDVAGFTLDWAAGIALSILALIVGILTVIIGGIVYAVRMRRKADG